jgi:imidazolonepropionase-like amidohydrolase
MGQLLFKNCQLLDLKKSELQDGYHILIENEIIREVSDRPIKSFQGTSFDLKGKVLMPGLIDAHVHVSLVTIDIGKVDYLSRSYIAIKAAQILEDMLMRGFTTVRDAGGADYGLVDAISEGCVKGPRLFISGRAITQTTGHGDFRPRTVGGCYCRHRENFSVIADGVPEVRKAVREELRQGAHQIKVMASGGVASPRDPIWTIQYSIEELRGIVEEAKAWNTYVMAHAYTPQAIQRAVECGVRSIEHGNLIDAKTAQFIKNNHAYVVPTLVTYEMLSRFGKQLGFPTENMHKLLDVKKAGLEALSLCKQAGVKIGHGSDLVGDLHSYQSEEFMLKSEVLSPAECLYAATITNAEMMNLDGKLGVIAPNAFADLLVVNGNPLKDLKLLQEQGKHLVAILKNGVFYKNQLKL